MYLRKLLLFFSILIVFQNAFGQTVDHTLLSKKFKDYQIVQLPSRQLYSELAYQRTDAKKVTFNHWDLTLFDSEIISPKYQARLATEAGIVTENAPRVAALNGYTRQGGRASLTFADNFVYGFVEDQGTTYYIEPLYHQTRQASVDQFIIYKATDILDDEEHTCATDSPSKLGGQDHDHDHGDQSGRIGLCYEVEYSIASDFLMFQSYGSSTGVQNHAIGVLNNVQTNYDDEFLDELQFIIVEQFVSTCATCDPWTSSTNAEVVLNSFTNWAPGGFAFTHDIGSLWTNRNFDGSTIGIAWVGAVCTPIQYNALEDFSSNANLKRVMVAHEFGHNFDASHDPSGSPNIMAPAVQNTTTWSAASKTDMQNYYNSVNCLDFCATTSAPQANFTYTITSECAPGTVQFTNQSTGTVSLYEWEFEGGTPATSNLQNPVINYTNPGVYSVTLTVSNGPFSNSLEMIDEITILPVPDANFTFDVNGNEVTFTNTSQAGPNAVYTWDFDDGTFSNEENPVHVYTQDGSYSVLLTIDDICGFDNRTRNVVIATAPIANFTANQTSGCGSFNVAFTNTSTSNATIFDWEFPGGSPNSSILANPVITYSTPGSYPVSLTATNAQGSNTKTIANYITVSALPTSSFTFAQTGLTFAFTSQATNTTGHLWNFGDGNTSTQINPTHTYASAGNYTVSLITANGSCPTSSTSKAVTASTAPVSAFSAAANVGCAPFTAAFTNSSANNPTTLLWQFPGGTPASSTAANPSVTYALPGTYDVTLITSNSNGSDTLTLEDYIEVGSVPNVSFVFVGNQTNVAFIHTGAGANAFNWNFGDGSGSAEENPVHTYQADGTYTVVLTSTNACGSVNTSQSVQAYLLPQANATHNTPTQICEGNSVTFADVSSGTVFNRLWQFEGGSPASSTDSSVVVTYATNGIYNVSLIVSNPSGNDTLILTDYVTVNNGPNASITPTINGADLKLTNAGSNYTTSSWLLPGNVTSTQAEIEFTATENGSYKFYLFNNNDCGTAADSFIFQVNVFPVAVFTSSATVACAPASIVLNAPVVSGATYQWSMPGGTPSTASTPAVTVVYPNTGSYDCSLIVSNAFGSDTAYFTAYVQIYNAPQADFDHTVNAGLVVDFQFTGNNTTELIWNFAGLGTSSSQNPQFTFPTSGTYPVSLIVNNECGSDTITKEVVVMASSTQDSDLAKGLILYPNPTLNQFYIEAARSWKLTEVEVYNMLGQKIVTTYHCEQNRCTVNSENWVPGNYHVKVKTPDHSALLRMSKM